MKTSRFIPSLIVGLSILTIHVWSRPVDLSAPTGGVGATDLYGDLEVWREVEGVGLKLGRESYLPLRYKFTSADSVRGILGPGFYLPLFESKNVLIREQMMRAYLPCGKGLYMRRDNADSTKFKTLDGEWTGLLNGENGEDFTIWRSDGWKLRYHKGHLASLITDDNHTFTWSSDSGGMPTGVAEDGKSVITIEPNVAGQVAAFIFNGNRYEVAYAERPLTQILLGQIAIKELAPALATFKYPNGKSETFKFALTPARVPTLTFTDKNNQQTLYTWDTLTNHLTTEKGAQGEWSYKIGVAPQDHGVPPISRTSSEGKTEGMTIDSKTGTYAKQADDRTTTITHIFETPGPLFNKVQKVEETVWVNGKEETSTIYRASYDEMGNLLRETDARGFLSTYIYESNGKLAKVQVAPPTDAKTLNALKIRESAMLGAIVNIRDEDARNDALEQLAFFYFYEMGRPDMALALIPRISNNLQIFNIKLQAIEGDRNLVVASRSQALQALLKIYPEHKQLLVPLIQNGPQYENNK